MIRLAVTAVALTALGCSAQAREARSVEYFIMHNHERAALVGHCDPVLVRTVSEIECANANRAATAIWAAENRERAMKDSMDPGSIHSPAFWDTNTIARHSTLRSCAHPVSALSPDAATCRAAHISEERNR